MNRTKYIRVACLLLLLMVTACGSTGSQREASLPAAAEEIPASARSAFDSAVAAMNAGQWSEAETRLQALIRSQPNLSGAYLNLALIDVQVDRAAQADENFRKAIAANPDNLVARNQYAIWLRTQGRFGDAEQNYRAALERQPADAATHLNLGILYDLYQGKWPQALEHYEQYLALSGESGGSETEKVKGWVSELKRRANAQG
jgi:Tfp pilus assembly protein PilF